MVEGIGAKFNAGSTSRKVRLKASLHAKKILTKFSSSQNLCPRRCESLSVILFLTGELEIAVIYYLIFVS